MVTDSGTPVALQRALHDQSAPADYIQTHRGAAVDLIEFELAPGTKLAKVKALAPDLALAVGVESVRIIAPIPGTTNVGIEVPAVERTTVAYKNLLGAIGMHSSQDAIDFVGALPFPVGQRVGNGVIWADLAATPHMLIAGATGSGKSVALNTILTSLIDHTDADTLRLHLVDPKRVELGVFAAAPQVENFKTDVLDAIDLLHDLVDEMERRYEEFEILGVRNITEYLDYDDHEDRAMPYHVLVIDEVADLMLNAKDEVEPLIAKLTQLARAAGIHLILATQRPSVNVITGVIKANIPTRWAFTVASGVDSKVILDSTGAEALYGKGDSLWAPYGSLKPDRIQAVFTSDDEVQRAITDAVERHLSDPADTQIICSLNQRAAVDDDDVEIEGVEHWEDSDLPHIEPIEEVHPIEVDQAPMVYEVAEPVVPADRFGLRDFEPYDEEKVWNAHDAERAKWRNLIICSAILVVVAVAWFVIR